MKKKQMAFGCMRISALSIDEAEVLIKEAINSGITLFDHADIYGNRRCEEIFGEVLKRNPNLRAQIKIQSKCGMCNGYYDLSKEHIINQVIESIRLLQCGYLDVLLLHRPDALVDYQEVNEAFDYLFQKGLVKEFGLSNVNAWQLALYKKYVKCPIEYNQVQFSIVHSQMISQGLFVNMRDEEAVDHSSGMLEYAMLNDITIQAWSPLMASWSEGSFINHPNYPKLNEVLDGLANKYQVSKNAIAISWILRHPTNIIPIIGTTKVKHLKELVKAMDVDLTREEWYKLYLAAGHYLP